MWGNFIISVHMSPGEVKLTSVQILLRSYWPKWNFKPHWVFHVNSQCRQWNKVVQNHFSQLTSTHVLCLCYWKNNHERNTWFALIKLALIKNYHLRMCIRILLWIGKLALWNRHVNGTIFERGLRSQGWS